MSAAEMNQSLTELNLCAVYSQLNEYDTSLSFRFSHHMGKTYAQKAVDKIEKEIDTLKAELKTLSPETKQEFLPLYHEKISLLAIANYNLGSQHEFLGELTDSMGRYELALTLVQGTKEKDSALAQEFKQSLK